ncbi:phosphatase PAP2 family protein [Abyssisolibacter fermentans]|uniref:phosphatase PAP2 family protein n=1 Tax=Abyssisolibacter fermentans TaxID=1766203 RepID=UPI00082E2EA1|nr:phosphatase PAP2 family protein [Abyssisolibacter fermentans]
MVKNKKIDTKVVIVIVQLILLNVLYLLTNKLDMRINLTTTSIDYYIPLIKCMIIPYDLWYVYIWGGLLFVLYRNKDVFFIHAKTTIIAKILCIIIFILYPTYVIRPEITGNDIFSKLLILTYASDNPVNALPSLHVLQTVITHVAITKVCKKNDRIVIFSFVVAALIILATMFTKQHSLLDVVAGMTIGVVAVVIGYWKYDKRYIFNGYVQKRI